MLTGKLVNCVGVLAGDAVMLTYNMYDYKVDFCFGGHTVVLTYDMYDYKVDCLNKNVYALQAFRDFFYHFFG